MSKYKPAPVFDPQRPGLPICSDDACPAYDGKRCHLTGFRPDTYCEPALLDMASALRGLENAGNGALDVLIAADFGGSHTFNVLAEALAKAREATNAQR